MFPIKKRNEPRAKPPEKHNAHSVHERERKLGAHPANEGEQIGH